LKQKLNPNFSVEKAHKMQQHLSEKLSFEDKLPGVVKYIAGVDVAYFNGISIGAVAVLDFSTLSMVEFQISHVETCCPYVPTLLSFREIPPAVSVIKKLHVIPDVFLVDGQGFAHPYGLGFASHLGLILEKPTVGVAKSILCGKTEKDSLEQQVRFLKMGKKIVGAEVITRSGIKPVYVSVGHKISLDRAIKLVLFCTRNYRLPEPIRRAHIIANMEKKNLKTFL
jgi:deoxyribonuclease V